ncbi:hypothetical protein [Chryseobacterium taiwanense]|uniref:Uncharacterized protein n=1 Tax=Chryseobacterium taiwanense TaxID=363331 RepID=A0A0B4D5D3_9FLAO|nr:hypothetical protein [Chryseobacterium taiwanense]KIC61886.1 hypothetical protein RM51_16085 [Chryseobacterium taiwanense]
MFKKKLLINEVFEQVRRESGKESKSGQALYLCVYLEENLKFLIADKTLVRYYDAFLRDDKDLNIDSQVLDKLSEYIGYKNFMEFSRTFTKKGEETSKTIIKIDFDDHSEFFSEKRSNIIVNITNLNTNDSIPTFKIPNGIKQNGLGFMELLLLALLLTSNIAFSSNNNSSDKGITMPFTLLSRVKPPIEKDYMYWNGERYIATDSSFVGPGFDVVAMNEHKYRYFQKIMRKDTLSDINALGRTWYSKYDNIVEFFTDDGVNPENGRELRKSTPQILYKYAGRSKDITEIEE